MPIQPIKGHCLCGDVTYTINSEPQWCGHCHCASCRRQTASAVATFVGCHRADVDITGKPMAMFESSPGVRRFFCPRCGTPVAYEADVIPGELHLLIGTLEHPEDFVPSLQVFSREKLPWLEQSLHSTAFEGLPQA